MISRIPCKMSRLEMSSFLIFASINRWHLPAGMLRTLKLARVCRRALNNYSVGQYSEPFSEPTHPHNLNDFDVVTCAEKHFMQLMNLTEIFTAHEPQCIALNLQFSDMVPIYEHVVAKAVRQPYSLIVTDKDTDKPIGFRIITIAHRNKELDQNPVPLKIETDIAKIFWKVIMKLQDHLWTHESVKKVLRQDIAYISPEYQRLGLASQLIHFGLDFNKLVKQGFDGIVAESTIEAGHQVLARHGYSPLVSMEQTMYKDDVGQRIPLVCEAKTSDGWRCQYAGSEYHQCPLHDDLRLYFKDIRSPEPLPLYTRQCTLITPDGTFEVAQEESNPVPDAHPVPPII